MPDLAVRNEGLALLNVRTGQVLPDAFDDLLPIEEAWAAVPAIDALISQLMAAKGRLLVRIGDDGTARDGPDRKTYTRRTPFGLFEFDPKKEPVVSDPQAMALDLSRLVAIGEVTALELEAAVAEVTIPAKTEWKVNNTVLNTMERRSNVIGSVIRNHRVYLSKGTPKVKLKERNPEHERTIEGTPIAPQVASGT